MGYARARVREAVFRLAHHRASDLCPSTINLKTNVHTRPIGERPLVELEPTEHPLAVEQRTGITRDRVREIAEALLHGTGHESG